MATKDLFINSVQLMEIEGSTNIPTVLCYKNNQVLIGTDALAAATERTEINEDFKIELGNYEPGSSQLRAKFPTANGTAKTAAELASDFFDRLIKNADAWLSAGDVPLNANTSLLIAEPLVLETALASDEWLSNYRRNLRRILSGKGFETVEFLPEPFAVFQYYRYGLKHPIVAQRAKIHALVVDMGGGTCDACIIETTKDGDISQSNRNSKPLAASSVPVAGFFFNRAIAETLFLKYRQVDRIKQAIKLYKQWRRDGTNLDTYDTSYRACVKHFHETVYRIEDIKLAICRSIPTWNLDAELSFKVPFTMPEDPMRTDGKTTTVFLSAAELRHIFVEKLWKAHLKGLIHNALARGKEELNDASISVVLLSGGSANIGWLNALISRDFRESLEQAQVLTIPDFQEVVAKGLALECARRFYNAGGDFASVTYNRLCLVLDPDETACEPRPFTPKSDGLPDMRNVPGVLLPSASSLRSLIDKPMRWRVKLNRPPHKKLEYYFLRSSFDPGDLQNLQNVQAHTVYTPPNCTFDSALQVQLTVHEDGTALPRFVYKSGRTESENTQIDGQKFFMDMTSGQPTPNAAAYVGIDFGTSNSAVSFVNRTWVQVYEQRVTEGSWRELNELVDILPYPMSLPLARYLAQTDTANLAYAALEFIETALGLITVALYAEYCTDRNTAQTRLLKNMRQRSVGPLWNFFNQLMQQMPKNPLAAKFKGLTEKSVRDELNGTIDSFAQMKHHKLDPRSIDTMRIVSTIAQTSYRCFDTLAFGFFEGVQKAKFGMTHKGFFRIAHGRSPFVRSLPYEGTLAFSADQAVLVDTKAGTVRLLSPLVFWETCQRHQDSEEGHCYFFDKTNNDGSFSFKASGFPCVLTVDDSQQYSSIAEVIAEIIEQDPKTEPLPPITLARAASAT